MNDEIDGYSEASNSDRIKKLTTGRWGESEEIAARAYEWYVGLGITVADAERAGLHPIVEYVANCLYTGDPCEVNPDIYLDSPISVTTSAFEPATWTLGSSRADSDLRSIVRRRIEGRGWTLRDATPDLMIHLERAVDRLAQISTDFTESALRFTRRHAFVGSDRLVGRTWVDIGGLIISGDQALESTDTLAESVFHESLHAKFYAIERGLELPTPDMGDAPEIVRVPWQQTDGGATQHWSAHRALDAFYVYVHLGALRTAALHADGKPADVDRLRRIAFRSAYLSRQIRATCRTELDGQRLQIWEWLDSCRVAPFDLSDQGEQLLATADAPSYAA